MHRILTAATKRWRALSPLELAGIFGRFHALAEKIEGKRHG